MASLLALAGLLFHTDGLSANSPGNAAWPGETSINNKLRLLAHLEHARIAGGSPYTEKLKRFYQDRSFMPVWMSGAHRQRAQLLLTTLASAADHGLDPSAYQVTMTIPHTGELTDTQAAHYEWLLTDSFIRYASDVRTGRAQPKAVVHSWDIARPPFDPLNELARALAEGRLAELLATLPPSHEGYAHLVSALRQYRVIARQGGWPRIPHGPSLRPGQQDRRIPLLRERLMIEGDLNSMANGDNGYDTELEEAIRRFQSRHGLAVDGIVGPATLNALNVAVETRIQQILVNMTRWRWLPRDLGSRYLTVNAADARLKVVENGQQVFTSKVIVGTRRHPTPVLESQLETVIFNPPWTVPSSIALNEILPKLRRNPHYLAQENIVIMGRRGIDPFGLAIDWSRISARHFDFRLQQLPGPNNALGQIKFDFPNRFSVYLHDTPQKKLFEQPGRTFSHGCVRVERARELAAFLLANQPQWNMARIDEAIASGLTEQAPITRPLTIYLLYWTVFVDAKGQVHFREDFYGRDQGLARLLQGGTKPGMIPEAKPPGCE